MIYLTSGANGAGKTLNTLKAVREKQVLEGRTVYYNGFAMKPAKATEFGWLEFDPKKWQDLPDGAILICDECQNEFPVRPSSEKLPEYVRALSEHRRRGFDFYMITQHPQNIDMFVRRLIGSPGYHRHLKRAFGANMVSVLEWSAVNGNCEKDGAGKSARVSMVAYPKEVYEWYDSASLHTAKRSIPKQVYVLVVLALVIPALFYLAFQRVTSKATPTPAPVSVASGAPGQNVAALPNSSAVSSVEYTAAFVPRVEGLAYTAPRYDEATKPTTAPYPAACIASKSRCECYTQQGTKLPVPPALCSRIVKGGFFMDWQPNGTGTGSAPAVSPVAAVESPKLTGGSFPETRKLAESDQERVHPDAGVLKFMHRNGKPSS
jgi:zona occludens toxin